jgi:hypothetical protein
VQDKLFPPARNIERENLQRCANALRFKRTLAYESGVLKTFSRVLDRTESLGTMQARRKMSFFGGFNAVVGKGETKVVESALAGDDELEMANISAGANQADATDEIEMANISAGANQADATSLPGAGLAGTGHDELEKATISAVNIHPVDAAPAVDDTQPQQRQEASGEVTPRRRVIGHYVV